MGTGKHQVHIQPRHLRQDHEYPAGPEVPYGEENDSFDFGANEKAHDEIPEKHISIDFNDRREGYGEEP